MSEIPMEPNRNIDGQDQSARDEHTIYRGTRRGKHERPIEETGLDVGDPNLAGGIENAEAIEDIVGDGILEARHAGSNIDEGTARTIARALVHALSGNAAHLDTFASTGVGDRRLLEQEYFELYGDDTTPKIVRNWIDWLASFLFWRDFPDHPVPLQLPSTAAELPGLLVPDVTNIDGRRVQLNCPASITPRLQALTAERLTPLLAAHGDAFRAYLTLPDIDATSENLDDDFHAQYVGAYEYINDVIASLTEMADWERDLQVWARERGLIDMVHLDRDAIETVARETWDIVEVGGRCYVFNT